MPERPATLTVLVAAEIRAQLGRMNVRSAELARRLGENQQWVSSRLNGRTPIDLNELFRIARALGVGVHQLLPSPEVVARAAEVEATLPYLALTSRFTGDSIRPRDSRPVSGPPKSAPPAAVRTAFLSRTARTKRA
jgi:transcriptional regulator with XRE-family HTH domain